jgi:hypothetical protein
MKYRRTGVVAVAAVLLVVLLTACFASNYRRTEEAGTVPKPSPGKSMVVFLRPATVGFGADFRVYEGERLMGVVGSETYVYYEMSPGKHSLAALSYSGNSVGNMYYLETDLAANKTYYVLMRPLYAFTTIFVILEPITPKDDQWKQVGALLSQCRRSELVEEAYAWEQKNADQIRTARRKADIEWQTKQDKRPIKPEDGM